MNTVIQLQHVEKVYKSGENEVHALKGVDLTVRRGEMIAVMITADQMVPAASGHVVAGVTGVQAPEAPMDTVVQADRIHAVDPAGPACVKCSA